MTKLTHAQQLWVDALRSGEYQQTKKTLQDVNGYCCLGVACDVAAKNGIPVGFGDDGTLEGGTLSSQHEVVDWLGLNSYTGYIGYVEGISTELTFLNDTYEYTFSMIADFIEQNADKLFVQEGN
jgi:hypothetical protein